MCQNGAGPASDRAAPPWAEAGPARVGAVCTVQAASYSLSLPDTMELIDEYKLSRITHVFCCEDQVAEGTESWR